jgi:type VI secretion system protein ImpF
VVSRRAPQAPLRPGLLDRLIAPLRGGAGAALEAIGARELCASLARDLEWLLNSRPALGERAAALPYGSDSILAYGLPDLSGYSWRSPGDAERIAELLQRAICRFEPRLRARTVQVSALPSEDAADFQLRFRIDAVLRTEPVELPVSFDTEVDLGASRVAVRSPL